MKRRMIETFILRHFDQTHVTILEINSFNYVNDEVLSQYDELKLTNISIKMFINHQALISLMKDKELSRHQMR